MTAESDDAPDGILSGLRIVEGSAFVAAPLGGMTLAQLGADVIRFDAIGGGVDYHRWPIGAGGESLYWAGLNKGKRSIALNLRSDAGRQIASRLITAPGDGAGLFLTNLPARGVLAYESLQSLRQDLVMVAIAGDPDGTSQVDYTVNAATGYPWLTGPADSDGPINAVLPTWDIAAGSLAAIGLLAGERHRLRTGHGRLIELALSDVAVAMVGNLGRSAAVELGGAAEPRDGNHLYGAFGHDFETGDGRRVMIVAITPRQWSALCAATEISEAVDELERRTGVDLATEGDRYMARQQIVAWLAPWVAARELAEIRDRLNAYHVSWSPYQTVSEMVANDPRASLANPMFAEVDHPGIGRYRIPASPLRVAGSPRVGRRAPLLGEHTDEILAEILGLSTVEIGRPRDAGVVAGPGD